MTNYIYFWMSKYMIELIGAGLILLVIVVVGLISNFVKHIKNKKFRKELEKIRHKEQRVLYEV